MLPIDLVTKDIMLLLHDEHWLLSIVTLQDSKDIECVCSAMLRMGKDTKAHV